MPDLHTRPRSGWIPAAVLLLSLGALAYLSWGWTPPTTAHTECGLAHNAAWEADSSDWQAWEDWLASSP